MCDHGDGHGHGHGAPCSSEVADFEHGQEGMEYNMNALIDKDKVVVLNESVDGSGVQVFKRWTERLDRTHYVDSDVDEESMFALSLFRGHQLFSVIFNIPFTGHVKITGLTLIGEMDDTHPSRLRIFKDRENASPRRWPNHRMGFDDASNAKPDQEVQLKHDDSAKVDYPLIANKFSNLHHLTLHFPSNFGAETSRVYYIGLRGSFQHHFREKVAIATYEARPMADDHRAEIPDAAHHHIC